MRQGTALGIVIWLHGYTQKEVAKELGVSRTHLTNIINGVDPLQPDQAQNLGRFLGVVPGRLLSLDHGPLRREGYRESTKNQEANRRQDHATQPQDQ